MLLRYFLKDFEVDPVAPVISGTNFVITFHVCCIFVVRLFFWKIFSVSVLITLLSPEIATYFNLHIPFSFSRITMSGSLLGMVLKVCTVVSIIQLPYLHDLFLLILVHAHTSVQCLILSLFPCIC